MTKKKKDPILFRNLTKAEIEEAFPDHKKVIAAYRKRKADKKKKDARKVAGQRKKVKHV